MPGLAAPLWLVALVALGIPIALHLWSRRPRQLVRVGSLRHLAGPQGPRAWGRRLEDLPLLALRLGLLSAVVLALAGIQWRRQRPTSQPTGTVVVADPAAVADSLEFFADPLVDSLRRAGVPIRLLITGTPPLGLTAPGSEGSQVGGLWSRLAEVDATLPPGNDLLVLANPSARDLGGARPRLSRPVRLYSPHGAQPTREVVARWQLGSDSIVESVEWRTSLLSRRYVDTVTGVLIRPVVSAALPSRVGRVYPKLTNRSVTEISMEVVADQRDTFETLAAVAALSAAIETATGTIPPVRVRGSNSQRLEAPYPAVLIWLSGQSVSNPALTLVNQGTILLEFTGKTPEQSDRLTALVAGSAGIAPIGHLWQTEAEPPGAPLLTDQYGRIIASLTRRGAGWHVRVASRLDPAWSDLALGSGLPELVYWLLTGLEDPSAAAPVSVAQARPEQSASGARRAQPAYPLERYALIMAALILLTERLVAHARLRERPA